MRVIADASPLMALVTIGKIDLLDRFSATVHIPPAVFQEIAIPEKPFARLLSEWARDKEAALDTPKVADGLELALGRGESEGEVELL